MGKEITSLFVWTMIFIYITVKANKNHKTSIGKTYKIHILLSWLLLFLNFSAFRMMGWAIGHPESIFKYFFISIGPLPAWFNLVSWTGNLVCSIAATLLSLSLASRKEYARIWLLRLMPIFYFFGVTEAVKSFYQSGIEESTAFLMAVLINATLLAIPYGAIFFFYKKEKTRTQIFIDKNINQTEDYARI